MRMMPLRCISVVLITLVLAAQVSGTSATLAIPRHSMKASVSLDPSNGGFSSVQPGGTTSATTEPLVGATVSIQFEELLQAGGRQTPATVQAFLYPWHRPDLGIELRSDLEGRSTFANVPVGNYIIRIYWPAGFAAPVAGDDVPDLLRGVFTVQGDGTVIAPPTLPSTWPDGAPLGEGEPFDPATDRSVIGPLPPTILLNEKDPGTISVSTGSAPGEIAVGIVDVGLILQRAGIAPSGGIGGITTPNAGSGSGSSEVAAWALAGAMALVVAAVALFAVARRRSR